MVFGIGMFSDTATHDGLVQITFESFKILLIDFLIRKRTVTAEFWNEHFLPVENRFTPDSVGVDFLITTDSSLESIGGNRAAVELEPACTRTIGIAERSIGTGSPACAAFMRFTENWVKGHSEDAIQ